MIQGDELSNSMKYLAYDFLSMLLNDLRGWAKHFNEIFSLWLFIHVIKWFKGMS